MSRYLVDTHVFLWMHGSPDRLGAARDVIEDEANELLLSAASAWEISIKWALGKLTLPESPDRYVPRRLNAAATIGLPVTLTHALAVGRLPRHHSDPFDRLLVAQARTEGIPLITADDALRPYDCELVWAG